MLSPDVKFETFVGSAGPRLRAALVAAYGPDVGADAASEALAYGWEHWPRLSAMENPSGYLYRVGQTAARRARRPEGFLPQPGTSELPEFEPGLVPALESLTEQQRVAVMLVHAWGWPQVEVAALLEIDVSSVRTHITRALKKLQAALEVEPYV